MAISDLLAPKQEQVLRSYLNDKWKTLILRGTIQGVTIEGDSYFRSSGAGGIAVVSGDSGFSFGACAMGSGHISIGTGNWNGTDFYTSGDVICSSVVVGGMALTSSDVAKLQGLKG